MQIALTYTTMYSLSKAVIAFNAQSKIFLYNTLKRYNCFYIALGLLLYQFIISVHLNVLFKILVHTTLTL